MPDQADRMRDMIRLYERAARPPRPRVIAVTSGKGGVGKSTVALNLALALADAGQRVLLVDADPNLASLDVMLGLIPRFRLSHVLRSECDIEDAILRPAERLSFLPGSSGDADYPDMTSGRQRELLEELAGLEERHDVIVIDTAAGLAPEIIAYSGWADETLVISHIEPTAIMDAYAIIKLVTLRYPGAVMHLILNSVHDPRTGEDAAVKLRMAVKHFLRCELDCWGMLPADVQVSRAVVAQTPVMRAHPRSAFSLSIQTLARVVVDQSLHAAVQRSVSV